MNDLYIQVPGLSPPRFDTLEDAQLFLKCLESKEPLPKEKWIQPYALVDGKGVISKRYADAPYEIGYFVQKSTTLVNCDDQ